MSELNSAPEVRKYGRKKLSKAQKVVIGTAATLGAGLLVVGAKNFSEATHLADAINSDASRAAFAGLAGIGLILEATNEAYTGKDDKGKYRAIIIGSAAAVAAPLLFLHGGGSSEADASSLSSTTVLTTPSKTAANGTIASTDSNSRNTSRGSSEAPVESVGGHECELKAKLPPSSKDGYTIAKIQGALNSLGVPEYNVGPTDGNQGPRTDAVLKLWKPANDFDPGNRFSEAMCNKFLVLTDGNLDTPPIPDYHPGS